MELAVSLGRRFVPTIFHVMVDNELKILFSCCLSVVNIDAKLDSGPSMGQGGGHLHDDGLHGVGRAPTLRRQLA